MHESTKKIKPNNAKDDVTPTVKLAIHKDLTFEDTKQTSQNRVVVVKEPRHMEKHYEGSNILFLESGAYSKSSQICIAFFAIYNGSIRSWIYEKNH